MVRVYAAGTGELAANAVSLSVSGRACSLDLFTPGPEFSKFVPNVEVHDHYMVASDCRPGKYCIDCFLSDTKSRRKSR